MAAGRKRSGAPQDDAFFDGFRTFTTRAPAGLVRAGPPASATAIAAAESALARPLPPSYASFLRSFDGAELFHESVVLYGVGPGAARSLVAANPGPGPLVFAETAAGDRFTLEGQGRDEQVFHLHAGSDERWLAGSSFPRWLDALVARESLLYDAEGEFQLEAFEEDGEELTPVFAIRQAERALRKDPGSAETHHALALALRRAGRLPRALEHFTRATDLDPANPWSWFDRARAELAAGAFPDATASFRHAADTTPGPEAARLFAWAARAAVEGGLVAEAAAAREAAVARDPEVAASLKRAVEASLEGEDEEAREEAEALVEALVPRKRLPVVPPARR